jgi:predicted phage terminase large subunit-like protein
VADRETVEALALMKEDFYTFMRVSFELLHPGTPFRDNWHLHVIAAELEALARGTTPRLILNLPPRALKSFAASVALGAWFLGHHPSKEVVCASYGQKLAEEFAMATRRLMRSRTYQAIFETRLVSPRSSVADLKTTDGGSRLATSIGGQLTGRGADLFIIDDPINAESVLSDRERETANRWYENSAHSRSNDKSGPSVGVVMQRLHVGDFSGHLLMGAAKWRHISLQAIAERDETYEVTTVRGTETYSRKAGEPLHGDRESLATLMETREVVGPLNFAAQYQQTPTAPGGNRVKLDWFARYTLPPAKFDRIIQSWDTASSLADMSSYSVGTTWGILGKHIYLLHVFRKRMEYPELKRAVREQALIHSAQAVLVEEKSSGIALAQDLAREGFHALVKVKPERDKEMRMLAQTMLIENGFVWLPKEAGWLADYEHELALFPQGVHDDQVDSTSQALQWFRDSSANTGLLDFYTEENRKAGRIVT